MDGTGLLNRNSSCHQLKHGWLFQHQNQEMDTTPFTSCNVRSVFFMQPGSQWNMGKAPTRRSVGKTPRLSGSKASIPRKPMGRQVTGMESMDLESPSAPKKKRGKKTGP